MKLFVGPYSMKSSPVARPLIPRGSMLPPAVKKKMVCVELIWIRKPPSMCTHTVGFALFMVLGS